MLEGTGLKEFKQKYPKRTFDVGIAEAHAVTFAAGMAAGGFRPVVAIYSTFLQRAYDQIMEDVCLQKLPVVFAIDRADARRETFTAATDRKSRKLAEATAVLDNRQGNEDTLDERAKRILGGFVEVE